MAHTNARKSEETAGEIRSCAAIGTQIEVVESIFAPDTSLVVLQRPVQFDIAQYLHGVSAGLRRRESRHRVTPDHPEADTLFADLPPGAGRDALVADYLWILELFTVVADSQSVGVRFATTMDQTCSRFHVDHVQLRLICTWQGPATEWLEPRDIDRRLLGNRSGGRPDEVSGLLRPGARICKLGVFDVGLMKGERWPGNEGAGLVHRSPVPGTAPRVMITMDALA